MQISTKCGFCEGFGVYALRKTYERWRWIIDDLIEMGMKNGWSTAIINLNIDVALKGFRKGEPVCPGCSGNMVDTIQVPDEPNDAAH